VWAVWPGLLEMGKEKEYEGMEAQMQTAAGADFDVRFGVQFN